MEIQWLLMCFVFLSLYRNYQGSEIKNAEELETRFKRNQTSSNASNILLNAKLSPETLRMQPGEQINQNQKVAKKRKLNRASASFNKQTELISDATKEVVVPMNTLHDILSSNRKSKKLRRTVKNRPNQLKTGVNANLTAIPPKNDLTLSYSQDSKNSTQNPEIGTKKEGTNQKYKSKTMLVEDDDDIEQSKNIEEKHRVPSSKSEPNVLEIMLDDTENNEMPKYYKLTNKTDERNLKNNNAEVVTVAILNSKSTSVVNDGKIINNHTKIANDTISSSNEKDNLSPKSIKKDNDLETRNSKKSNVKNYEPFNEYHDGQSNKSNTKNLPDDENEKPKTVPEALEASDKHDGQTNDSTPIKISAKNANKTSTINNTEQIGTIFKRKLEGSINDEEIGHSDEIIQIDQPFKIYLNEDNIQNETSISILSMLPNRSITIEKTNLEEIHETYHPNHYQNQPPEQENTQNNWYKSNRNYGQESQYPYQYGSYRTIPYSNNGYNSQYNYPLYQYGQPCHGFENYDQNIEENVIGENPWKEPLHFDTLAQYSQPNINRIFGNPFIEKGIEEMFETDPAINFESPDLQPTNRASDPISPLSARYRQPRTNNIFVNPLVENGYIVTPMNDPATVELLDIPLFRNRRKNTFKGSSCPNVQSQYMRMHGNLEYDKNVYGDVPQIENYFQKPVNFNTEPRFNKPNNQEYNQMQFQRGKNLDFQPLSKTREQNIRKDPFGEIQKTDSDSVYSKIETPTYYSFEQTPGYKDKIWRKWKNTRILINNLNKPIKIEMDGLNRLKTPSSYKRPISDGTVNTKLKTNQVNQKQPMKQCTY